MRIRSVMAGSLVCAACSWLVACCPPCLMPTVLPVPQHPAMTRVQFDPNGMYCIGDSGRMDMLINLERYRAELQKAKRTIERYNETVPK